VRTPFLCVSSVAGPDEGHLNVVSGCFRPAAWVTPWSLIAVTLTFGLFVGKQAFKYLTFGRREVLVRVLAEIGVWRVDGFYQTQPLPL
jgi:hypothetical protein